MKKRVLIIIISLFTAGFSFAGDIAFRIGLDTFVASAIGAAVGTAFATPSYTDGGAQANPKVFAVGASWGALVGAGLGFGYGIYDVIMEAQTKKEIKKTDLIRKEWELQLSCSDIKFTKTF